MHRCVPARINRRVKLAMRMEWPAQTVRSQGWLSLGAARMPWRTLVGKVQLPHRAGRVDERTVLQVRCVGLHHERLRLKLRATARLGQSRRVRS